MTALLTATRTVAEAPGVAEAARRALAILGEAEGWSAGIVWLLADGDDRLRRADTWAIEQGSRGRAAPTESSSRAAPESAPRSSGAPRDAILAGRAWGLGRPVFVGDLTRDDELRRDVHLEREGFRSAFAVPLPLGSDAGIAGVLELFGRTPREPDAFAEELWSVVAVELGQLARRVAVVHALAEADERLRTVLTERWHAEAALRQSEAQLIEADRLASLGTLAAGVAHEINNPLSYVLLNLNLLIREAKGEGESVPRLREARAGVERVRVIVQDLKSFSRGNTDRKVPVDVRRVLDSTLEIAANEIRHRAKLVRDFRDVPPVLADASRLGQVFLNLLVNAAHAITEGGEGDASRQELRVATSTDDAGRAVVEVADTGPGIAPENMERIFDPFFTTKPVGVGTGLGLSICRNIVTALGGDITVESRLGHGTTFRVVLPAASSPIVADEPTPPPASSPSSPRVTMGEPPIPPAQPLAMGEAATSPAQPLATGETPARPVRRRGRVLVIDDEPALGAALARSIERDYEVVVAPSGREALERLRQDDAFDVILCDLIMPQVTGMDLHDELRRTAPALADRMIFMTGGTFTARARDFLARVSNPALDKPFDLSTLSALLRARTRR